MERILRSFRFSFIVVWNVDEAIHLGHHHYFNQ